jgi:tetratricopeptide (TPR) repeat protein
MTPRTRIRAPVVSLTLLLLIGAVFAPSLGHGFVVLDDYSKIIENPTVTHYGMVAPVDRLLTPAQGYVIPVTVAAWAGLYALGNGAPWPFHLAALLLHALFAVQLFGFLRRWIAPPEPLVQSRGTRSIRVPGGAMLWAAGGAALFAVHPVVVEPVAWATGLKDLLAANLALGATALFVAGTERGRAGQPRLVSAVLVFLLAVLAKPTTVLVGGAWLGWLVARRRVHPDLGRRPWQIAVLTLALGLGMGLLSWVGHTTLLEGPSSPAYLGDGRALYALGLQAWHLFFPADLHPLYYVAPGPAWSEAATWFGVGVLVAVGGALWWARQRPVPMLGLGLMATAYLPVANVVSTPRQLADSYLYLPLAGALLAALAALYPLMRRRAPLVRRGAPLVRRRARAVDPPSPGSESRPSDEKRWVQRLGEKAVPAVAVLLMLGGLGWASRIQLARWEGGAALWRPLIARWPAWDRGYYGLGTARFRQRRDAEAAALYRKAYARGYRTEYLADYGVALAALGRADAAECVLIEAIRHGNRPVEALRNYGRLLGRHPRRPLRYPRAASHLVPAALNALARQGEGARKASAQRRRLLGVLRHLHHRLDAPTGPLRWPKGRCPLVRPARDRDRER